MAPWVECLHLTGPQDPKAKHGGVSVSLELQEVMVLASQPVLLK